MKFEQAYDNYIYTINISDDNDRDLLKEELLDFFDKTPNPQFYQLKSWAEEKNLTEDLSVEDLVGSIIGDYLEFIKAGKLNENLDAHIDEDELKIGVIIEREHTTNNKIARRIAMDHLAEIPDYYTRLVNMMIEAGVDIDKRIQLNVPVKFGPKTVLKKIK